MLYIRRWTVFVIITAIGLILIITFHRRSLPHPSHIDTSSSTSSRCPISPPSEPLVLPDIDGFSWRNVTVKNPVQSFMSLPTGKAGTLPKIQYRFGTPTAHQSSTQNERRDAVKKTFLRGWDAYRSMAWLHDELAPVSGGSKDTFGGWGATLVDSLDTLWIMDLRTEFEEAVAAAYKISFAPESSSLNTVNMFETTIRYLGGFLAAYDLSECKDARLLQKAVEMGDMIYASYDTPNRMPITRWDIRDYDQQQYPAEHGIIAELASSSLEYTRLSQLTGDMRYYDAIARITNILDEKQNHTRLPGMFPTAIGTRNEDFSQGSSFGFGAMADSAYEYFAKTWQLLLGREPQYRKLYEGSTNVASEHILYRPSLPDNADVLVSANYDSNSGRRDTQFQHLACFTGGMYLLGGKLFSNDKHVDIGKKLTEGCVWAYRNAPLGIMPEILDMKACPSFDACSYDQNQPSPFTDVGDPKYILRPEAIESVFYAYRITGDTKYQDMAWDMFQAVDKHTRTEYANAAIKSVMSQNPSHDDSAESFWFGETLKYFYLIFSEPDLISLDDWVFNTEAHPFRVPKG